MTISRDIDPDILKKIDKQVRRGATLLVEGQQSGHTPEHDLWVETFEGFIAILDPHGEDYGGSLRSRWYRSQYYEGNSPKTDKQKMSVFSKYLGVASSLFETGQVETAVFRSGYGEYLTYGRFDPSMHRLLMTEAGDGLHCVLFHPGWQYRSFPLSCSVLDWGSTRSQSTAQSSSGWVRRTFVEPSSPSQFVLSHYHADHYNGLLRASWHSLNQGRWQQIDSIYGPGFPKLGYALDSRSPKV